MDNTVPGRKGKGNGGREQREEGRVGKREWGGRGTKTHHTYHVHVAFSILTQIHC